MRAEPGDDGLDHGLHLGLVGHVALHEGGLAAQVLDLLHHVRRGGHAAGGDDDHLRALARERQRRRLPMPDAPPVTTATFPSIPVAIAAVLSSAGPADRV